VTCRARPGGGPQERSGRAAKRLAGRRAAPRRERRPLPRSTGGPEKRRRARRGDHNPIAVVIHDPPPRWIPDNKRAIGATAVWCSRIGHWRRPQGCQRRSPHPTWYVPKFPNQSGIECRFPMESPVAIATGDILDQRDFASAAASSPSSKTTHSCGSTLPRSESAPESMTPPRDFFFLELMTKPMSYGRANRSSLAVSPPVTRTRFMITSTFSMGTTLPRSARGKSIVSA
jgi:hypothetical protein